jgi:tetratricopeptide (TPR) repeat protein
VALVAWPSQSRADTAWAKTSFQQAEKLSDAGRYAEALALYEQIIVREPTAKLSYCRAGAAASGTGDIDKAIGYYKTCRKLYPEALTPRAELVKLYQIRSDVPNRDRERDELLTLHRKTRNAESKAIDHYTRDIFAVGAESVVAWEYFDLSGDWPSRYRFFVLDADGKQLYSLGLNSSAAAQAKAASLLGHKPKARVFHLDIEQGDTATNLKLFEGEPGYDTIRPLVVDAIRRRGAIKTTP